MPAPLALPVRRILWQRFQRGQSASVIADALALPVRTVRHLLQRCRTQGLQGLSPAYDACGRKRAPAAETLRDQVCALRRDHPTWGAGLLRVLLQRDQPGTPIAAVRTLQRWLQQAGLGPAPAGRRPT